MLKLPEFCRPCSEPLTARQQASGRRQIILYSILAMFSFGVINPNVLSLLALRLDPALDNATLSLLFFVIPFASVATVLMGPVVDRYGKKAVFLPLASAAVVMPAAMFFVIGMSSALAPRQIVWILMSLVAAFSVARFAATAGWFPLISDNVPPEIRGRYFGMLRTCWQVALFLISMGVAWFLGREPSMWRFQVLMLVALGGQLSRTVVATSVPEGPLETARSRIGFFRSLWRPLRNRGYRNFLIFIALMSFSLGFQGPFGLRLMRDELAAGDGTIVRLVAFVSLGAVASLYLVGRLVDRFGSRFVFAMLVPPMALLNLIWIFVSPASTHWKIWLALGYFGYGACQFGMSVAVTNMMFSSASRRHRAAYMGLFQMVANVAMGVAPFAATLLARWWTSRAVSESFSANRVVFAARLILALLPLAVLTVMSRRHGGRVRRSAGELRASVGALWPGFLRWRNP